ncbi:M23 family metallopeptidase, partial [Pseudoflavonifractor capillosus]|uniref:M23 family metallopeptidase n=1 Tax=Pseudoflavonifractor capillosus TaxID=106588 RepID=UPI0019578777
PTPVPTPAVVTAVAQEYSPEGVALPANVSYEYYELGLSKTVCPVMGPVTSTFGYRTHPITQEHEFHLALDIAADEGTDIVAFADGVVEYIGRSDDDFGLYLKITHGNGVSSFYAHCSKLLVQKGDEVKCGQTVALVGETGMATGPHLHLTIEKDNIRLDPAYYVDPS